MNESEYWLDLAQYDLETAKAMYDSKRFLYVGFMCHQVIEKALKAYYSSRFKDAPPYTHNLGLLAQKAGLYSELSEEQKKTYWIFSNRSISRRVIQPAKIN